MAARRPAALLLAFLLAVAGVLTGALVGSPQAVAAGGSSNQHLDFAVTATPRAAGQTAWEFSITNKGADGSRLYWDYQGQKDATITGAACTPQKPTAAKDGWSYDATRDDYYVAGGVNATPAKLTCDAPALTTSSEVVLSGMRLTDGSDAGDVRVTVAPQATASPSVGTRSAPVQSESATSAPAKSVPESSTTGPVVTTPDGVVTPAETTVRTAGAPATPSRPRPPRPRTPRSPRSRPRPPTA